MIAKRKWFEKKIILPSQKIKSKWESPHILLKSQTYLLVVGYLTGRVEVFIDRVPRGQKVYLHFLFTKSNSFHIIRLWKMFPLKSIILVQFLWLFIFDKSWTKVWMVPSTHSNEGPESDYISTILLSSLHFFPILTSKAQLGTELTCQSFFELVSRYQGKD